MFQDRSVQPNKKGAQSVDQHQAFANADADSQRDIEFTFTSGINPVS